jgi:hypothetical protein
MFFCDGEMAGGDAGGGQLVVGPAAVVRLHQANPHYSTSYHRSVLQHLHQQRQHHSVFNMAAYQNHQDELAQLQELSNKWEPEATVLLAPAAVSGQSTY